MTIQSEYTNGGNAQPSNWVRHLGLKLDGKAELYPGIEFTIPYRGRFIFKAFYTVPEYGFEWVTAYGGKRGEASMRSFRMEDMAKARVHRDHKKRQDIDRELAGRNK